MLGLKRNAASKIPEKFSVLTADVMAKAKDESNFEECERVAIDQRILEAFCGV